MKIEKVSENQIRCTLTKEDLADRKLQISELAYGTESARALFREMMQQAAYQYGFEADDIPLMIEAVPMSADSIVLIITKVEYPEELDTRFSKFSNLGSEDGFDAFSDDAASTSASASADDILDLFRQMQDREDSVKEKASKKTDDFVPLPEALNQKRENPDPPAVSVLPNLTKLFVFGSLDEVIRLAHILDSFYDEQNTLYKSPGFQPFLPGADQGFPHPGGIQQGMQYLNGVFPPGTLHRSCGSLLHRAFSGSCQRYGSSDTRRFITDKEKGCPTCLKCGHPFLLN